MDIENSYFLNPQCDSIKTLIRLVSFCLLFLTIFSFLFMTNSKSMSVFVQLLQILVVAYLVYLNLSWPTCDDTPRNNRSNGRSTTRITAATFGTTGDVRTGDAITSQPTIVG